MTHLSSKQRRGWLAERYGAHCVWCGHQFSESLRDATIEHLLPIEFGGTWNPANLRLACGPCNYDRNTWFQIALGRTKKRRCWSRVHKDYVPTAIFGNC